MPRYKAAYEFDHSPQSIYGILSDVESYSAFMPLCKRSRIVERERQSDGAEIVIANFLLRYRRLNYEQSLELRFSCWPEERRIKIDDPQRAVGSGASMIEITSSGSSGSRLLFDSDFTFKSFSLRWLMPKRLVIQGLNRIMERVRQRAEEEHQSLGR